MFKYIFDRLFNAVFKFSRSVYTRKKYVWWDCGIFTPSYFRCINDFETTLIILFVCFVALRPKSTAMVIAGRSVHLTTLFPGQA